jgi:hypothetical protein
LFSEWKIGYAKTEPEPEKEEIDDYDDVRIPWQLPSLLCRRIPVINLFQFDTFDEGASETLPRIRLPEKSDGPEKPLIKNRWHEMTSGDTEYEVWGCFICPVDRYPWYTNFYFLLVRR